MEKNSYVKSMSNYMFNELKFIFSKHIVMFVHTDNILLTFNCFFNIVTYKLC